MLTCLTTFKVGGIKSHMLLFYVMLCNWCWYMYYMYFILLPVPFSCTLQLWPCTIHGIPWYRHQLVPVQIVPVGISSGYQLGTGTMVQYYNYTTSTTITIDN